MKSLENKIRKVLKNNNFGTRKINKIIKEFYNLNRVPVDIFIKYNSKKYILDVLGYNPQTASVELMRPEKFREWYGGFDIPESDWI